MLYQRTVTLEETLSLILALLTKEDRKKKEAKEEKDELSSIPPIPNAMAARLLHMSPRQLQRVGAPPLPAHMDRARSGGVLSSSAPAESHPSPQSQMERGRAGGHKE